ncbi:hypothetical protein AJ80_05436 [Polytolypa hystricis UAMH7299]|uniref:Lysophospholipase n=1 Tax=Polytolypa hystricis (strain UAMH7299) TaxID=1447883 RepID=A0A2B7Y4F5_POLH7|nr:hypothetical protein AJ80_05436 [Polytolypa hystricis UAMH7299]
MGAARLLKIKWRAPIVIALAISGGGCTYHCCTRIKPLRSDTGRDQSRWEQKPSNIRFTSANSNGKHKESTSTSYDDTQLRPITDPKAESSTEDAADELEGPMAAGESFSGSTESAKDTFTSTDWTSSIKAYVTPSWTSLLPGSFHKLQVELSMGEGSLADEIWAEAHDPDINTEITHDAHVRIGEDLCREEQCFRWRRQRSVVKALASYLNLKEDEIHPDDVPVIAMCSSGGGLRALVAGSGSYLAAKEAGLWDCVTYTAGVSGTCWLQTLYYSSLGGRDFSKLVEHLKTRLGVHIAFPPTALNLLTTAPTNKYLLCGLIEKLRGDPDAHFGLVDIYSLLLAARLLVPHGDSDLHSQDLKLSKQKAFIDNGNNPLPIYTAVRHEIPHVAQKSDNSMEDDEIDRLKETAKQEGWFQWFEFTPYEFFCEELGAGIPIWALGRHFENGHDVQKSEPYSVPELRIPALMGIWGSAFCATLAHYYKEARPFFKELTGFSSIDSLIEEKNANLVRVHPFEPAMVPNYVLGLKENLPPSCPESIFTESHLQLMDAGMSNNLPIYPLLRPGRKVDVIIAFDVSADIKEDNWLSVVDGYARQRGIQGWPVGSGWPKPSSKPEETANVIEQAESSTRDESGQQLGKAQDINTSQGPTDAPQPEKSDNVPSGNDIKASGGVSDGPAPDLTFCNVWLGTTQERAASEEPPPSKRLFHPSSQDYSNAEFQLMKPDAGIAVVYFPFLANPAAPPVEQAVSAPSANGLADPSSRSEDVSNSIPQPSLLNPAEGDFMSTWNFVYTPEQVDAVVGLAKANFAEGEDQVKRVVRGIYERKKRARLDKDREQVAEGLWLLS